MSKILKPQQHINTFEKQLHRHVRYIYLVKTENVYLQTFANSLDIQGSKTPSMGTTSLKPRDHNGQHQYLWTWDKFLKRKYYSYTISESDFLPPTSTTGRSPKKVQDTLHTH